MHLCKSLLALGEPLFLNRSPYMYYVIYNYHQIMFYQKLGVSIKEQRSLNQGINNIIKEKRIIQQLDTKEALYSAIIFFASKNVAF